MEEQHTSLRTSADEERGQKENVQQQMSNELRKLQSEKEGLERKLTAAQDKLTSFRSFAEEQFETLFVKGGAGGGGAGGEISADLRHLWWDQRW